MGAGGLLVDERGSPRILTDAPLYLDSDGVRGEKELPPLSGGRPAAADGRRADDRVAAVPGEVGADGGVRASRYPKSIGVADFWVTEALLGERSDGRAA